MDHVPVPANCTRLDLKVPFLAQDKFDGLDFKEFPSEKDGVGVGYLSSPLRLLQAMHLRSWLYFGMLDSILGHHVDFSLFTRYGDDGRPVLTTARLPQLLSDWAVREPHEPKSAVLQRAKAMNQVLGYVGLALRTLRCGPQSILSRELWLSTAVLCDILTLAKLGVIGHRAGDSLELTKEALAGQHTGFSCDFSSMGLFQHWCPYEIERLHQTANPSTMYFAGHLAPLRNSDHSTCSKFRCTVTSPLPHSAQHRTPDCHCSVVNISSDRLDDVLRQDEIPVVCLSAVGAEISVSVQRSHQAPYIAISHVWADGLGNETDNSLTMCQLAHLSTLARRSRGGRDESADVRLWIDTLCVPVSGPGRKQAILMMAQTYRDADLVLALDRGLQTATRDVSAEELLVRIVSSPWAGRLWTLQEGAFAKKLHFQFRDKTVDLDELTQTEIDHTSLTRLPEYVVYANLHNNLLNMRMVGASDMSREEKRAMINGVMNLLLWRQTTKAVDEWTCFSTLLGHDVAAVLQAEPSQRAAVALGQQIFFPKDILFNSGPRQSLPGLRWAPKSFLRSPQSLDIGAAGIVGSESEAMCTSDGLFVKLPGIDLSPPSAVILGAFEVYQPESNTWLRVVLCDEETSIGEEFASIQPRTDRVQVDTEHNTFPYPSWVLIFDENYRPREPGVKDTAVLGYVAGAATIGRGYEGLIVRFVQRVIVVTTTRYADNVIPGPDLAHMHGKLLNGFPWFIG